MPITNTIPDSKKKKYYKLIVLQLIYQHPLIQTIIMFLVKLFNHGTIKYHVQRIIIFIKEVNCVWVHSFHVWLKTSINFAKWFIKFSHQRYHHFIFIMYYRPKQLLIQKQDSSTTATNICILLQFYYKKWYLHYWQPCGITWMVAQSIIIVHLIFMYYHILL